MQQEVSHAEMMREARRVGAGFDVVGGLVEQLEGRWKLWLTDASPRASSNVVLGFALRTVMTTSQFAC